MSFSAQEIEEFKVEARELLDVAEKSLLSLDEGGDFRTCFDGIFRGFHNVKGASAMMEMPKLSAHVHELENILMGFKSGPEIPKNYISLFLRGVDAARSLLNGNEVNFIYSANQAENNSTEAKAQTNPPAAPPVSASDLPDSVIAEFIGESEEIVERISKCLHLIEEESFSKEDIDSLYRDIHSLKGSAYLFSYTDLGNLAHSMESSLERVREGTHRPSKLLVNGLFRGINLIENIIARIKQKTPFPKISSAITALSKILTTAADRLPPADTENGAKKIESSPSENSTPETNIELKGEQKNSPDSFSKAELKPTVENAPDASASGKEIEGASTIRVPVSLLDSLMTLMGEMVLVRNQVLQYSNKSEDHEFLSMSKRLNVVTSEIQEQMMKTRMQPIGNILTKFNRVVRDLSQELGKNIVLNLTGAETELDKSLLEAIKDPLTHIVRNACDHGIETREDRKKTSKPQQGTIHIKAYHEGGQVVVDVSDDGKGLHKEMILKKALEKGLIAPGQDTKLTEKEIFNLIFAPGFSTAAKVTSVSGRGVGMDVVRTNIERIGGTVDLASVPDRGTTIKIKIPLTLAIVPALIVKSSNGTYAIPQVKLEELVRLDQSASNQKIEMLHGTPVYRLRGNILPLVDLNGILRPGNHKSYAEGVYNIAVLNAEHTSFGLIIDEIQDTADIVVKPINRLLKSLHVYSGATVLGDGNIALILDVTGLAKVANINQERSRAEKEEELKRELLRKHSETQDYLLVGLNSPTRHAIVLSYVYRLEEFSRSAVELSGTQPVIRYGSVILPLISANKIFGYEEKENFGEKLSVVVVQRAGKLYGIQVDSIIDTLSTQIELDATLEKRPGIFGNLNTQEELIVVLDPFELITEAFPESAAPEQKTKLSASFPKNAMIAPPNLGRSARVLLVEDTVFFRKAIKGVLESNGYEVTTASNGKEALEILGRNEQEFDLIVSDIEMPQVNGFQFALAVRKDPNHSRIPMLAVSARADQTYVSNGKNAGFDLYLEKFKPSILLNSVAELISKGRNAA